MSTTQDCQVFKERCEDSPGILIFCQGDWRPTPERLQLLREQNYYVLTAANGFIDIVDWLPYERCMGGMFAHPETVAAARQDFPDKVVERFEGVGGRFLRTLTQELPFGLHNAGAPFTAVAPVDLKTIDVVSIFSPVPLKRGQLLVEALVLAKASAYIFSQSLGSNPALLDSFLQVVRAWGCALEYIHLPFDPYALICIDGRIVIDGRPIGANNAVVSAYLARARMMVHTSTTEGISNAVMEALLNDVPVLLCEDIRGPLQKLSLQLPQCFTRSAPEAQAVAQMIDQLRELKRPMGAVRSAFLAAIDPFEINRRVVRSSQAWFSRQGLPWKGHCLGLFGGVQSKLDLGRIDAHASYRGSRHIYPSAEEAFQCANYQFDIAFNAGNFAAAACLRHETALLKPTDPAAGQALPMAGLEAEFVEKMYGLGRNARIDSALLNGAAHAPHWLALLKGLLENPGRPTVQCIEALETSAAHVRRMFPDQFGLTVHCASAVRESDMPDVSVVAQFHASTSGPLAQYPLVQVLGWLREDLARAQLSGAGVIGRLREVRSHAPFGLVVIDGSEFSAQAELQLLIGANIICLGSTRTFKGQGNLRLLSADPRYVQMLERADQAQGLAVFMTRTFVVASGW